MAVDLDQIYAIVERVAASSGLEVVEIELRGGGKSRMLRIFIDKPGGAYTLEVSSPGLDRKLFRAADFERFQGSRVKLTTKEPVNDNRHFEGRLERFADGRLTLDL